MVETDIVSLAMVEIESQLNGGKGNYCRDKQ